MSIDEQRAAHIFGSDWIDADKALRDELASLASLLPHESDKHSLAGMRLPHTMRPVRPTQEQIAQMQRDYLRAIAPVIRLKAEIISFSFPVITIKDGVIESHHPLDDQQKTLIAQCDSVIDGIAKSIFGTLIPDEVVKLRNSAT